MIGEKKQDVKEYRKLDRLSASDLRLFTMDRRKFFKTVVMKEGEEEEEEYSKSLLIGDIVHTLLLTPDDFDEKYFLSICPEPPTGIMLAFTEALYKHTIANLDENGEVRIDFTDIAMAAHSESGFKWTLDRVMAKFEGSNAELYYKELREARSTGRQVVCVEDLGMAEKIVERIRNHSHTADIFSKTTNDRYLVFNEKQIEDYEIDGLPLKSMPDKIIVDLENKIIDIYDPKVVWEVEYFYREYYLKRRAYLQALLYHKAVQSANLGINIHEYAVQFPTFVVCDSANFYAPIKYQLGVDDMQKAYNGFYERNGAYYEGVKEIIENIKWCQETGDWSTKKSISDNQGWSTLK